MAVKLHNGKYKCSYCEKIYAQDQAADDCRSTHDIVYLQISKNDLNALYNFIYTKENKLISETLLNHISRLVRKIARE
jgi:hypothetical protein